MKHPFFLAALGILGATSLALAQPSSRLFTRAVPPAIEALDRLHLRTAWRTHLPLASLRDGVYSFQIIPNPDKKNLEIFVQTRGGRLLCLDAESGVELWSTRVGTSFRPATQVAANRDSVFLINNVELYALDRATGLIQWETTLASGATAPPSVDNHRLYLSTSAHGLSAYDLPILRLVPKAGDQGVPQPPPEVRAFKSVTVTSVGATLTSVRDATGDRNRGPQPTELFSYPVGTRVELAPLLSGSAVLAAETGGAIVGMSAREAKLLSRVPTRGDINLAPAQHDSIAYVAGGDATVHAFNIPTGSPLWRYPVGAPIVYPVVAHDEDLYVTGAQTGLIRLERDRGVEMWTQQEADRFVGANPKFVYALDRSGYLLVLDRSRGSVLSRYAGTRDFVFPISNEWTDRIYLAANNGLVICLHDKDYGTPVDMKKRPLPEVVAGGEPKEEKKDVKKDEKKE